MAEGLRDQRGSNFMVRGEGITEEFGSLRLAGTDPHSMPYAIGPRRVRAQGRWYTRER